MRKKIVVTFFLVLSVITFSFGIEKNSMVNNTVDVDDEIYSILITAELNGYCSRLSTYKPYSEFYILKVLDEISDNLDKLDSNNYSVKNTRQIIEYQKNRFTHKTGEFDLNNFEWGISNDSENFPITFFINDKIDIFASDGIYPKSDINSLGYDLIDKIKIFGNVANYVSYKLRAVGDFTCMPLVQTGDDYVIGYWWNSDFEPFAEPRTIKVFRNYSVLPYSYKKPWTGSVYWFSNLSASGLEGWPFAFSGAFNIEGELHSTLLDGALELGFGRYSHDLASMDTGSSLVLNQNAMPFMGFDLNLKFNKYISFSEVIGALEFPNQGYINSNAWYLWEDKNNDGVVEPDEKQLSHGRGDSLFFQNMFVAKALNFDIRYLHFDIGSSVIFPKRFEPGYALPVVDCLMYQNSLGDYDNLSIFTDLKAIWPGIGYLWGSFYLDETNELITNIFEKTRCMFAYQAGLKVFIPWLPLGNLSFRYTKIEPYCYTHNIVVYYPYCSYPVAESYTNNGYSLGYYLPPNSDEFLLTFDCRPSVYTHAGFSYQLIRHGTDLGNGAVPGSNLYSELTLGERESLRKYFLYDGTYEWTSVVNFYGSYNFRQINFPLTVKVSVGYVIDWFTGVETNGIKNSSYSIINTSEYKPYDGIVASIGITVFGK